MKYFLIVLDKHPGAISVEIGETLCCATAKLIMRAARDQAKTACGSLQLFAGLEAGIEGETHAMARRRREGVAPVPGERDEGDTE